MFIGAPEPMPAKEHDEGPFSIDRRIQFAKRNISPALIASLEIEPRVSPIWPGRGRQCEFGQ
jgi:hypothetical protein